jgi:hypothetical protein
MEVADAVGASAHTVTAADAEMRIDPDNAVIQLVRGPYGTDLHARRKRALVADHRQEEAKGPGGVSGFDLLDPGPPDAKGHVEGGLARHGAGSAPEATGKVHEER